MFFVHRTDYLRPFGIVIVEVCPFVAVGIFVGFTVEQRLPTCCRENLGLPLVLFGNDPLPNLYRSYLIGHSHLACGSKQLAVLIVHGNDSFTGSQTFDVAIFVHNNNLRIGGCPFHILIGGIVGRYGCCELHLLVAFQGNGSLVERDTVCWNHLHQCRY